MGRLIRRWTLEATIWLLSRVVMLLMWLCEVLEGDLEEEE